MSHFDYPRIRSEAHALAAEDASAAIPPIHVRISDIDGAALTAFASTWEGRHPSGYGGFDWKYLWHRLCRQEPRNFQCALWHGYMLCGLAMGTVPRGHSHLTIRYMEGRPQGHPLHGHVARIVMAAAEYYALGLDLPQVRIENPAPGLEPLYRELGFSLAFRQGAVRCLAMDLPNDRGEEWGQTWLSMLVWWATFALVPAIVCSRRGIVFAGGSHGTRWLSLIPMLQKWSERGGLSSLSRTLRANPRFSSGCSS